jgi:hypothetical protein
MAALIHAAGVIHSHNSFEARRCDLFLHRGVNFDRAGERARLATRADEDVMAVLTQAMRVEG